MNRKGFTMIEILATLVIVGILSGLGIVLVNNYHARQRQIFNNHQVSIFIQTAKIYFNDHRELLPVGCSDKATVTLQELQNNNYIDQLLDYDKNPYDKDSYVSVIRVGKKIIYSSNLIDDDKVVGSSSVGTVVLSIKSKDQHFFDDKYYSNKPVSIQVKMSFSNNVKVATYEYRIKKEGKLIYTSECGAATNSDVITLDPKDYSDGEYKVTVTAYSENGDKKTSSINIVLDTIKLECSLNVRGVQGLNDWYVKKTNINVSYNKKSSLIDESYLKKDGAKINNDTAEQVDTKGTKWSGYVKDKVGNVCEIKDLTLKVDTIAPTIDSFNVSSSLSYNTLTPTLKANVSDTNNMRYEASISEASNKGYNNMINDIKNSSITTQINVGGDYDGKSRNVYLRVSDEAGNITTKNYNYNVYQRCSQQTTNYTYTDCSKKCDGGTRTKTTINSDFYLSGVVCSSSNTQEVCNTISCCSKKELSGYGDWSTCSSTCGSGIQERTIYYKSSIDANVSCDTKETKKCSNTSGCCNSTKTVYGDWGSCKRTGSNRYAKHSRTVTKVSTINGSICSSDTETKKCTPSSHEHSWNARGTKIFNSGDTWTCSGSPVHTGLKTYYKIYCSICGIEKTDSPTRVCPKAPYGKKNGWVVVND